jgi:hypothetical protein
MISEPSLNASWIRVLYHDGVMRQHPEMIEGPEAFERLKRAVKAVLTVPKSAMPPSPFGKSGKKRKKAETPKG